MGLDSAIERILELSAEAQIMTGAIVAYRKALGLLAELTVVQTKLSRFRYPETFNEHRI